MAAVEHWDPHNPLSSTLERQARSEEAMPEEPCDCPLGEFPMLAPELISLLRNAVELRPPGLGLCCCADEIHDAVLVPDDEILVIAKPRVSMTGSPTSKSLPA
jgi:hypothetical protein